MDCVLTIFGSKDLSMINQFYNTDFFRPLFTRNMACFVFGIVISSCSQDKIKKSDLKVNTEDLKIDRADSVSVIISKQGETKALLKTKEFVENQNAKPPYLDMTKGLKVDFFDENLEVETTLTANSARFYTGTNNIMVQGNVVVVNKKGEKLNTEHLIWNNQLQRFYTQQPVRIDRGGSITTGSGLEANKDFSWIRIYRQAGTVPVEKGQLPEG